MGKGFSKVIHVAERVIFPPLLIDDAVLKQTKSDFYHAQKDLKDAIAAYTHQVTLSGHSLDDMHIKMMKVQFIIGHLNNQPNFQLPSLNLSEFNDKGWQVALIVTEIATQLTALIALVLPEPLGLIAAIVIPVIGDIIKEGEEIGQYESATETMKKNLSTVTSAMSKIVTLQEKIHTETIDLDKFNNEALQTVGKADWSQVENELSLKFNESIDALATATPDTIEDLADQLLSSEDKEKLITLWNSKQKLEKDIASIC
jgi:hypothetical protein